MLWSKNFWIISLFFNFKILQTVSKALFFIFWDEAGRYLHLVKNLNNCINSKQATQKATTIWVLSMRCHPSYWPDNQNPVMAALRLVAGYKPYKHLGEEGTQRCPSTCFVWSTAFHKQGKTAFLYQHTEQRIHTTATWCRERMLLTGLPTVALPPCYSLWTQTH